MNKKIILEMGIKVGDTVRFLNSIGGGTVRSIAKNGHIMVETGDGFEIPSLARELVVVESLDSQVQKSRPKLISVPKEPEKRTPDVQPEPLKVVETVEGDVINVFLAFVPDKPKLVNATYEAYLINESNYFLYYNYMSGQNNSWVSRHNGLIEPNTKIFIEEFDREAINSLKRVCIQLIAFKRDKPYKLKNAMSAELRIDTVTFFKMHCFMPNDYFDEDALLYHVVRSDAPEEEMVISVTEIQEAMQTKTAADSHVPNKLKKKKEDKKNETIEVDLHINQLLDSYKGMSNGEILNYQLDAFHRIMTENIRKNGQKIIFIHGKGDGVLRASIEKELRHKYKTCTFQDASFQEYGFGATLVTIR